MLRLLIFAVTMLLLSSICNGQGRSSFGATRSQDTSFTIAQVKFTAYGGSLDTMLMIVMPNGDVKKVSKNQFGSDAGFGLLKSGNTIYADTSILFKQGGNDFGISTGIIGSTSGSLDIIAYNDSKITLGNQDVTTFNLNLFRVNDGSLTQVDRLQADSLAMIGTSVPEVWSPGEIVKAALTVYGGGIYADNPTGEHYFKNSRTSAISGSSANVVNFQHMAANGSCAAKFTDSIKRELAAVGYQAYMPPNTFFLNGYAFLAASMLDSNFTYINNRMPPGVCLAQQWMMAGVTKEIRKLDIDTSSNIKFRDINNLVSLQLPAAGGLTYSNTAGVTKFSLPASGTTIAQIIPNTAVTTTWGSDGIITHQATTAAGGGVILANSAIPAAGQFLQLRVKNTSGSDISTYIFKNNGNTASGATNGASDFVISNDAGGGNIIINNSTATGGIRFFLQDIERGAMDSSAGFNWGNGRATRIANSGKFSRYAASAITNGQLLIGHTSNGTFEKATLTGSAGVDVTNGAGAVTLTVDLNDISDTGLPVYADNAAALAGGLVAGQLYRTSTGQLMIVF